MRQTLFDKYGGYKTIHELATIFYGRAMESPVLSPYFEHADMAGLIKHQTEFLGGLMGGPIRYTNKELEQIHSFLDITEVAFDTMVGLVEDALYKLYFDKPDIVYLANELRRRKRFIVGRKPVGLATSL